jgi:hypothetical protein
MAARRATARQRKIAAGLMIAIIVIFGSLWLSQKLNFDYGRLFEPCGMKQRTGLPCPTCGMTTSVLAFARGEILRAFYVQPAAAFLCSLLVLAAFFAFLVSVFGVYFIIFDRMAARLKIRDIILGLLVVLLAGWAVTLSRALAGQP